MNVIIYSTQIQTGYIKSLLTALGVKITQITRDLLLQSSPDQISTFSRADLALVDPQNMDAGIVLNQLRELKIPVVLMVEVGEIDWDRLLDIDGFGYLQINSRAQILEARLKAILRRFTSAGSIPGQMSEPAL